jgi:hypothetical protein
MTDDEGRARPGGAKKASSSRRGPRAKATPEQPAGPPRLQASTVEWDKIDAAAVDTDRDAQRAVSARTPRTDSLPPPTWRRSSLWFGAAVVFLVMFGRANIPGGSTSSSPTVTVPTVPAGQQPPTSQQQQNNPSVHGAPTAVWHGTFTVEQHENFSLDSPSLPKPVSGFEVSRGEEPGESLVTYGDEGKVAPWPSHSKPSLRQCIRQLAGVGTGQGEAKLEPASVAVGKWICAETPSHLVARLRLDAVRGYNYTFTTTVYEPGT